MEHAGEKSGFTVLELVVALSIVSFSLAVIYASINGRLDTASRLIEKRNAVSLAEHLLSDPEITSELKKKESLSGVVSGFKWKINARQIPHPRYFQDQIGWPHLSLLSVQVYHSDELVFDLQKIMEVQR